MDTKTNFSGSCSGPSQASAPPGRIKPGKMQFEKLLYKGMSKNTKKKARATYIKSLQNKIANSKQKMNKVKQGEWSSALWNINPDGTTITEVANQRMLTLEQSRAFKAAIEDVANSVYAGKATFQDMPPKPLGVSIIYYREILRRFGIRIKQGKMSFLKDDKKKPPKQFQETGDAVFAKPETLILPTNLPNANKRIYKVKKAPWEDPDPLWYVIFAHTSYPDVQLTSEQMVNLESNLNSICSQDLVLTRSGLTLITRCAAGTVLVLCKNEDEQESIKSKLKLLSETANTPLKLIDQTDLNNSVIMVANFIGPSIPSNIISKLLAAQNNDLDTRNWIFDFTEPKYLGDVYKVTMNSVSSELIKKRSNSLFYGLKKVGFKLIAEEIFNSETVTIKQEEIDELQETVEENQQLSPRSDHSWDDVKEEMDFEGEQVASP